MDTGQNFEVHPPVHLLTLTGNPESGLTTAMQHEPAVSQPD